MSGTPLLTPTHLLGLKPDVADSLHFLDEQNILYVAGHNVVVWSKDLRGYGEGQNQGQGSNMGSNRSAQAALANAQDSPAPAMKFIPGSDPNGPQGRTEINALAISPNKRYVAVAERGLDRGFVHVWDLRTMKKKKTLFNNTEMHSKEYVSLSFSPDSKFLLTQGGAPDYTVINWNWAKTKPVQYMSLTPVLGQANVSSNAMNITQCSFCPYDPTLICITGLRTLLFLRLDAQQLAYGEDPSITMSSANLPTTTELSKFRVVEPVMNGRSRLQDDCTCHTWLLGNSSSASQNAYSANSVPTCLVVGTGDGQLLYFDNLAFRGTIRTALDASSAAMSVPESSATNALSSLLANFSPNAAPSIASNANKLNTSLFSPSRSIETLLSFSNGLGFVAGCDSGVIKVFGLHEEFARDDDASFLNNSNSSTPFSLTRSFHVDENQKTKVKGVAVSPNFSSLVAFTEDQQLYSLTSNKSSLDSGLKPEDGQENGLNPLGSLNLFDTSSDSAIRNSSNYRFVPLVTPFHTGPITGLDVCIRKPLFMTCGTDRTVRVWNYITKMQEIKVEFPETPHCVSIHPSGLHCLVGFTDKLRLMNLLINDIRIVKEFPIKGCSEVQFSHGGHMFAAMNVGLIQIYNTYSGELLYTFRGHTLPVKSLYWSLDDTNIVSAGLDGAVYERKLGQTARTQELVQKGCKFSSALCTEDDKIYAVGDDHMLKEIVDKNVHKTLDAGVILTQLVVSYPPQRMLFAGTLNGVVRSFAFPLTGVVKDYQSHCRPITRLRITFDDGYLISTGEDGCIAIFNIKEKDGRVPKSERPDRVPFSEDVLVTRSDLEEKNTLMNELRAKVDELTASNEYQVRLHDINHGEKLKDLNDRNTLQLETEKNRIEKLREEKQKQENEMELKLGQLRVTHSQQLHLADLDHQKGIMKEVNRFQKLHREMEQENEEMEKLLRTNDSNFRKELEQLRQRFEQALVKELSESRNETLQKNSVMREYNETKEQLEEDIDRESELLKDKYENRLAAERDATLRLKGENGIMRKKFKALQKDIDDQSENIRAMYEKEEQLLAHIKTLEERIQSHKTDIRERDRTIGDNEKLIYDLKKDNQELEKFKFVLDFQIKELKRQIEPRENEISDMKDSVMKMDTHLEQFHKENSSLKSEVDDLRDKLLKKMNEITIQRSHQRLTESELNALRTDVNEMAQHIQDLPRLRALVRRVFNSHVTEKIQATEVDPDVSKEYRRQRGFLEKSVDALKKKLSRDHESRSNDNMRLMQDNVGLIKEINKLRKEIKLMNQLQRQKDLSTNPGAMNHQKQAPSADSLKEQERQKLLEMQRNQIASLRMQIEEAQARLLRFKSS